ncbi:hypothetical protein P040_00001, partial [Brucella melitensis 11-1823-3434]
MALEIYSISVYLSKYNDKQYSDYH